MSDAINYFLSSKLVSGLSSLAKSTVGIKPKNNAASIVAANTATMAKAMSNIPLWKLAGANLNFVRIAGLSGAAAVTLAAYGAHHQFPEDQYNNDVNLKSIFETANRFHFIHTIALLGCPIARRPIISGSLVLTGMVLFCFPCYYRSLSGDVKYNKLAPIGGMCLILAWLSFVL